MNKIFLEEMKRNLLSQKKDLLIKIHKTLDIDADGDEADEVQANLLVGLASALSERDVAKISSINNSLSKIETGIYGLCEDCEEHIPEKRLLANPSFLTCIFCAELREKEIKQRKRD